METVRIVALVILPVFILTVALFKVNRRVKRLADPTKRFNDII